MMARNIRTTGFSPYRAGGAAWLLTLALLGCQGTPDKGTPPFGSCEAVAPPSTTDQSVTSDPFQVQYLTEITESDRCLLVEDIDGDGHLDIVTADRGAKKEAPHLEFYWGGGDGTFEHASVPIPYRPDGGCALGDLNDDGHLDILMAGRELFVRRILPMMGLGSRTFLAEPQRVVLSDDFNNMSIYTLALVDIDPAPGPEIFYGTAGLMSQCNVHVMGSCEIYIEGKMGILRQNEEGLYREVPELLPDSLRTYQGSHIHSLIAADLNDDGVGDYLIGTDVSADFLLHGVPGGGLIDVSSTSGLPEYNHTMGMALADYDGDGKRDLYLTDLRTDLLLLAGCDGFFNASEESNVAALADLTNSWGTVALDVELDGDMDVFTTNSDIWPADWEDRIDPTRHRLAPVEWAEYQRHFLLQNDGKAHFSRIDMDHIEGTNKTWFQFTVAAGDLDEDGDRDLILVERPTEIDLYDNVDSTTHPRIYFNHTEHQGHWLKVIPRDTLGRPARGVRVTIIQNEGERMQDLYTGGGTGGHLPLRAHFGLGENDEAVTVRIRWPGGEISEIQDVAVDQAIEVLAPTAP